ncbi:MAG: Rpn family recombination-promoting nuclease/putative transposase [Muribaculaceae bacterium]|nr:Rpn family recombination-promoting nuclease/putative transposase [Muribaculaceae bacterium]
MPNSESIYINPLTDFGFKFLFGKHADKEFILSFLNSLINGPSPITDVTFIDKEKKGEAKDDRALIYDLHCELADKTKIIVEMQNRYQSYFDDRAIYYLAADIYSQGEKGDSWNYKLTPVYGVFLMNFDWKDSKDQHLREDICLYNMQSQRIFSDKMRMTFLKIPMMEKDAEECQTTLERWLYLLKNMETMESIPRTFMQDPVFRRLGDVARYGALSDKEKKAYKESLKIYRDNYAIMETERTEGRAEGLAEGLAEGRAEGLAEGLAKGRTEGKLHIARAMLADGMNPDMISKYTGLSLAEISNL